MNPKTVASETNVILNGNMVLASSMEKTFMQALESIEAFNRALSGRPAPSLIAPQSQAPTFTVRAIRPTRLISLQTETSL